MHVNVQHQRPAVYVLHDRLVVLWRWVFGGCLGVFGGCLVGCLGGFLKCLGDLVECLSMHAPSIMHACNINPCMHHQYMHA